MILNQQNRDHIEPLICLAIQTAFPIWFSQIIWNSHQRLSRVLSPPCWPCRDVKSSPVRVPVRPLSCCTYLHIYEPCVIMSRLISSHRDCPSAPAVSCCCHLSPGGGGKKGEDLKALVFPFHLVSRCWWRTRVVYQMWAIWQIAKKEKKKQETKRWQISQWGRKLVDKSRKSVILL